MPEYTFAVVSERIGAVGRSTGRLWAWARRRRHRQWCLKEQLRAVLLPPPPRLGQAEGKRGRHRKRGGFQRAEGRRDSREGVREAREGGERESDSSGPVRAALLHPVGKRTISRDIAWFLQGRRAGLRQPLNR